MISNTVTSLHSLRLQDLPFFAFGIFLSIIYGLMEFCKRETAKLRKFYMQNTVIYEGNTPTVPQTLNSKGDHVFLCGPLNVQDPCCDQPFGVSTKHPYLDRKVETYMWKEI